MLERVIESWLGSLNERQYQIPFCQLLQAEGEHVVYISTHGQAELGVDVLTIAPDGIPNAYQLKRGDVALSGWRDIEGEIVQLVEYDPWSPRLPEGTPRHRSYVVTNGVLRDTVLNAINQRNKTWERRSLGPLVPVVKDELVSRFVKAHARFFPTTVKELSLFFELFTEDGTFPLDKGKVFAFLSSVIPEQQDEVPKREILQAASSIVLLMGYVLKNKVLANNHWALFEGWTVAAAAIQSLGQLRKEEWKFSLTLCMDQAEDALRQLSLEVHDNKALVQGSPFSDGIVIHYRKTILCGLQSAYYLALAVKGLSKSEEAVRALAFVEAHAKTAKVWGEGAFPYLYLSALVLEANGRQVVAENLAISSILTISLLNDGDGIGLPNPYWEPERCLRRSQGMANFELERFKGHSYLLESFVHFLARRWRRVALKMLWERITQVNYATTHPLNERAWLAWNTEDAELSTLPPNKPESWERLRTEAEKIDTMTLPEALRDYMPFNFFFALVFAHRFQPTFARSLEAAVVKLR